MFKHELDVFSIVLKVVCQVIYLFIYLKFLKLYTFDSFILFLKCTHSLPYAATEEKYKGLWHFLNVLWVVVLLHDPTHVIFTIYILLYYLFIFWISLFSVFILILVIFY